MDPCLRRDDKKGFGMTSKGFTLAEILVVIAIIAIIGTIMVAIFINTLRGSSKSQILSVIKQNGQSVLESMDKVIRGADNVVCPNLGGNTLVVASSDETGKITYTRFRLIPETSTANGSIQQDFPDQLLSGESIQDFVNTVCTDPMGTDSPIPIQTLTDTNTLTGVSADSTALFTIEPTSVAKNTVTVKFELAPAIGAPATIKNQVDPVPFQTTIKLRNS